MKTRVVGEWMEIEEDSKRLREPLGWQIHCERDYMCLCRYVGRI